MSASGPVSQHAAHLGTLAGPVLLLTFWATWSELRAWMRRKGDALVPTAVLLAAALSVGAAAIHAMVTPSHLQEDLLYGGFFAALTVAQLGWAGLVVLRPQPWVLAAGAIGNIGVVALWGITRTVGIPLGIAAGQREAVGILDVSCGLLELGIAACCMSLAWHRHPVAAAA
jgi:hypothetical protein